MASAAARRSPETSVRSEASMATSVPVPMRQAEVGLRERGRVVDAVADHRDDAALGLQAADDVGLVGGQHLGDDLVDADLGGDGAGGRLRCRRSAAPGRSPSAFSDATASAERRLDGVGDDEDGGRAARPSRRRSRSARAPRRRGGRRRARAAGASPSRPAAPGRPTISAWPSTTPSTPRPSRLAKPSTAGSAPCGGRGLGDGPGDRVLGGVLERADEPQRLVAVDAVGDGDLDEAHPAGGDGAGLVEHDRVDARGWTRGPRGP